MEQLAGREDVFRKLKEIEEPLCHQPAGSTMARTH